jgi:hypothetical protein
MNRAFVARIIGGLVLLAALAGLAYLAFNAGLARGAAINLAESGRLPQGAYGMPYYWHAPFFAPFGLLGCLLPFFLVLMVFASVSWLLWGPRRWMHRPGMWQAGWHSEGVPPRFAEWHRRAHEQGAGASDESDPPGAATGS